MYVYDGAYDMCKEINDLQLVPVYIVLINFYKIAICTCFVISFKSNNTNTSLLSTNSVLTYLFFMFL